MIDYLYRHVHIQRTTKDAVFQLLKDLLCCNGSIVFMRKLSNGFSEAKFSYWETSYNVRFPVAEDVRKFEDKGWITTETELVSMNFFKDEKEETIQIDR